MINFTNYGIEMWDDEKIASFRRTLPAWYDNEKRDLPWRRAKNPYHTWVSEVILQQIRAVTVIPYYKRFSAWFPTVGDLAKAPEGKLLEAWEGLGYYSRVRNMQKAAQEIMDGLKGEFPSTYDDILSLKGTGPYTAGAIVSIASDLPDPTVDSNIIRAMTRLFEVNYDIGDPKNRKIFQAIMEVLIDPECPGDFNQAFMDLGADIESAKNPRPGESPIRFFNAAYLHGIHDKYPIKLLKKKPKSLQIQVSVIRSSKGDFLLEKNTDGRLLSGFWSFPIMKTDFIGQQFDSFETDNTKNTLKTTSQKTLFKEDHQLTPTWTNQTFNHVKHTFSHQKWTIGPTEDLVNSNEFTKDREPRWVAQDQLSTYPMATPQKEMLKKYLRKGK